MRGAQRFDEAAIARLARHLTEAPEEALFRMNPLAFAAAHAHSLEVGLHTGPCIAVELNEQLDYFGQTVNVAARVQNLAGGGEIVRTDPVWRAMGVQERITGAKLRATEDRAQLKGAEGDVTVYRLKAA